MEKNELILRVATPLHSYSAGPIKITKIDIDVLSLQGSYLKFAYLRSTEDRGVATIYFGPNLQPDGVDFYKDGNGGPYNPDKSKDHMVDVVLKKYGSTIDMPKPVRE